MLKKKWINVNRRDCWRGAEAATLLNTARAKPKNKRNAWSKSQKHTSWTTVKLREIDKTCLTKCTINHLRNGFYLSK